MDAIASRFFNGILDAVYDAGIDASRWRDVIAAVARMFPQAAISLELGHSRPGLQPRHTFLTENYEPAAISSYAEHYVRQSPWLKLHQRSKPGEVYSSSKLCPSETFADTAFYNDWVRRHRVPCEGTGCKVFEHRHRFAALSLNYDKRLCERLDRQVGQSLTRLLPHLRRAVVLNRHIAAIGATSALEAVVDALKWPALLLRRDCSVIYANDLAEAAIRNARGFIADGRRLTLRSRKENELLRRLVAAAVSLDFVSLPDRMMAFPVDGESGPNVIELTPLPYGSRGDLFGYMLAERSVLATIRYRADQAHVDPQLLMQTFGFTPAESEVVAALAEGASVGAHAESTGRSIHTVRLHTKRALAKAECHSQAQLVQMLGNLQALGRHEGGLWARCPSDAETRWARSANAR
jgi:DNA-binding CsgD family transcriptional regulator